ncbi:MAG: glycosyltransferase [Paludibacteraceae bacterium]|nr:glycosyltransferase [Paludibacteraceae bacterium]
MKVLYLTQWYPHRYDNMLGLFVRKHAEAVAAQGVDVCVLFFWYDKKIDSNQILFRQTNGVKEVYVYYCSSYFRAVIEGWKYVKTNWGIPDLCQLNVITKNALLPLWLKLTNHIPYVVAEHWSAYLPQNEGKGKLSKAHRLLAKLTVKHAAAVMPVSLALEQGMKKYGLKNNNYIRLYNVVDDFFYSIQKQPHQPTNILHVSCFDNEAKNVIGLLRAVGQVSKSRNDFVLTMVGSGQDLDMAKEEAKRLELYEKIVFFKGELQPYQVAEQFALSDIFVLFSNYENAPVVLSESMAVGVPIISTNVGGIPQMVDSKTGILIQPNDEVSLQEAIIYMLDNYSHFSEEYIKEKAKIYSYQSVGNQLISLYRSICQ